VNDDSSAQDAVFSGQGSNAVLEGVLDAAAGRNNDVGPVADVAFFVLDVTVIFAPGVEMAFSRITPVSDDVSRLMNVESVLLRGRLGFESGEIQRDFQFMTHFLDELHGALNWVVVLDGRIQHGIRTDVTHGLLDMVDLPIARETDDDGDD